MFKKVRLCTTEMAALMLPSSTEANTEEKASRHLYGPTPCSVEDHKLIKRNYIRASRRIIINTDSEEGTGKSRIGKGWLGHRHLLVLKWTFDSLKLARPLSYGVQLASSFRHHARCIVGETMEFPNLKITINKFWSLLTTRACSVLLSKSTEIILRTIRDGEPRTTISTFTQLLSSEYVWNKSRTYGH